MMLFLLKAKPFLRVLLLPVLEDAVSVAHPSNVTAKNCSVVLWAEGAYYPVIRSQRFVLVHTLNVHLLLAIVTLKKLDEELILMANGQQKHAHSDMMLRKGVTAYWA